MKLPHERQKRDVAIPGCKHVESKRKQASLLGRGLPTRLTFGRSHSSSTSQDLRHVG